MVVVRVKCCRDATKRLSQIVRFVDREDLNEADSDVKWGAIAAYVADATGVDSMKYDVKLDDGKGEKRRK